MNHTIKLILADNLTGKRYKTDKHNDNKKKDDFHREVKPEIIKKLDKKIKSRIGENGNIEIADGEIVYVSQQFDEKTGKRIKKSAKTGIKAEDFFTEIGFIILLSLYEIMEEFKIDFTFRLLHQIESENQITIEITTTNTQYKKLDI